MALVNRSFTQKAQNALNHALTCAREMGHAYVGSEHLLLGLLSETDGVAARVLAGRGVRYERTQEMIGASSGMGEASEVSAADMTPRVKRIIENSGEESRRAGHGFIGTEHLLLAIAAEKDCEAVRLMREQGASPSEVRADVAAYFGQGALPHPGEAARERTTPRPTARLRAYARDLCAAAAEGRLDPVIGREAETERVLGILCRRTKNNPCLIGEPGVGKTAVVEGLAQRLVGGEVPDCLRGRRIWNLDIPAMIAGAKYRGEFEERMRGVVAEAAHNREVILFIDELHTLIGAGGAEGALDAANLLKPALARGEIQLIGATTDEEYRRHIERDGALARRFQTVTVGEPDAATAAAILRGLRDRYEAHHTLSISDEAIEAAVRLSVRYIGGRRLPDKAIDLLDEAASARRLAHSRPGEAARRLARALEAASAEKEEAILAQDFEGAAAARDRERQLRQAYDAQHAAPDGGGDAVTAEDVAAVVTAWTGIPVARLEAEERARLAHLETALSARVIGQEAAVSAVARAVRRGRAGLKDPRRPAGSFLFLGPTGVGKTALARALAEVVYGPDALIRIDMSEYTERHDAARLIGSPPGYVGYGEGGWLTERVRARPYSVVLFDEAEKAHPALLHLLLQILEDGRLTDGEGRTADFTNAIVILTSNVGSEAMLSAGRLGFDTGGGEEMPPRVRDALRASFRPELLNRIDEIVTFGRLTSENLLAIAENRLADVAARLAERQIAVRFAPSVRELVAAAGNDARYGARPLRRAVTSLVEDALSEALLGGRIAPGDAVEVTAEEGRVLCRRAAK